MRALPRTLLLWLFMGALFIGGMGAVYLSSQRPGPNVGGSDTPGARIEIGTTIYRVSVGPNLVIPGQALQKYGTMTIGEGSATNVADYVTGSDACALPGVDPRAALVMPAADDLGAKFGIDPVD